MQLDRLFPDFSIPAAIEIFSIENDSRLVDEKTLFIAYTGFEIDLGLYIPDAYERGCRSFLIPNRDHDIFSVQFPDAVFITVDNIVEEASRVALEFYGRPDRTLCLIGITGTNGKTTVTSILNDVLRKEGYKTALFGTLKWQVDMEEHRANNTTPDFLVLIKGLKRAKELGVTHVILEVSSHALSLGRVCGLNFDLVGWTNLSHDHLDYHKTIDTYFQSKSSLFLNLFAQSQKINKHSFINIDNTYGMMLSHLMRNIGLKSSELSISDHGDWAVKKITMSLDRTHFEIQHKDVILDVQTSLLGRFNVENLLMVYAITHYLGVSDASFLNVVSSIHICGRLEKMLTKKGVYFFVDFAHTPDALEKALSVLKEISDNRRLFVVFGAGGDRDPSKRKRMAEATNIADFIVLTSDNPRTEDPETIVQDIKQGFTDLSRVHTELDRKKALEYVYYKASSGDLVLVAGKGHEDYQILGTQKIKFSDQDEITRLSLETPM